MLFPVRCFTCGAPVGHLWEEYEKRIKAGEQPGKVLDDLGVKRCCCRRMFLSYVDVSKEVLQFPKIS